MDNPDFTLDKYPAIPYIIVSMGTKKQMPIMLTSGEAALILGISRSYVIQLSNMRRLPFVKTTGGHRRFDRKKIERIAAIKGKKGANK